MAVNADGRVVGSVSGGCVEGAVVAEALQVIADGRPRLVRFGYSDDEGFAVGLTCGGVIDIFVSPGSLAVPAGLSAALAAHTPVVVATVVALDDAGPREPGIAFAYEPDGPAAQRGTPILGAHLSLTEDGRATGSLGNSGLERSVARDARGLLAAGRSAVRRYGAQGEARSDEVTVFFETFAAPPEMLIFGAVDFTAALSVAASFLGYTVTVCDARAPFATAARFPAADRVVVDWPHRYLDSVGGRLGPRDAVCVLTHDSKFDVPAIVAALATDVGYIGAMGSRRTDERRRARLRAEGVSEADLARIHAPIGLDLGAATPEETAVAICAEIIAGRNRRAPVPLRDSRGPIHATPEPREDPAA
jgi:xanthine dehydrogenase accessory factor